MVSGTARDVESVLVGFDGLPGEFERGVYAIAALRLRVCQNDYVRAMIVTKPLFSSVETMRKPVLSSRPRTFSSPSLSFM